MDWLTLAGISIGLAMDAFAVSLAAGLVIHPVTSRHVFRLAFHFGLFQFLMPILGWSAGKQFAESIRQWDHWVAFGLLVLLGCKMLWDARRPSQSTDQNDPTRGLTLITLSVATSIDALAVGLSLAFLEISIWLPAVTIGLVAAGLSVLGVIGGARIGASWGRYAGVFGGCVLIAIGVKILIEHLSG